VNSSPGRSEARSGTRATSIRRATGGHRLGRAACALA
jgi:hypothetical protein